jgi:hypothetical protein
MNKERAGDRVFADVDQALAGRIVSRSMENSRKAAPAAGGNTPSPDVDNAARADDFPLLPEGALPLVKTAALLLALLVLMLLILRRKAGGDD